MVINKEMLSNGEKKQKLHLMVMVTLAASLVLVWMPMYKITIWGAAGSYALHEMDAAGLCWIATGLSAVGLVASLKKNRTGYLIAAGVSCVELLGAIVMLFDKNGTMKSAEGYLYQMFVGNIKMTGWFWMLFVALVVCIAASIIAMRSTEDSKINTVTNLESAGVCPRCGGLTTNGKCPYCDR